MKSLLNMKFNRKFRILINNKAYNILQNDNVYLDINFTVSSRQHSWGWGGGEGGREEEKKKFTVALTSLCSRYEQLPLSFLLYNFSPLQMKKRGPSAK